MQTNQHKASKQPRPSSARRFAVLWSHQLVYATEIQEFGDGNNRQGVRLTLLNPQLQDSGHYICTAENQFEARTETVQLSVWLPGSPQIDPEFWSDENTSRHLATNHGARVLNLTDEQILWEYNNIGANKKSSIGGSIAGVLLSITALGGAIAGLAFGFKWYKQRVQTTRRDEKLEISRGFLHDKKDLGLLDEEVGQQSPQTAHSEVEETHDTILLDDIGGASCDSEGEDETAPLLDKTAKKQSTDDNSREREKGTKGDNKREGTDKAREERINGGKKEGERIPIRDTDQPEKRDKEVGTKIKEGVPRHTDKPEQDTEKTDKERKAKDIDGESIANDKEEGGLRGGDDLEEEAATKKKKDTQTGTDNPETKDREEMVEEKERGEAKDRKDINQAEAEVKGEKIRDSKGDTSDKAVEKDKGLMEDDPLVVRDTEETIKERKRGGSRDISQTETKDKGERMKEWGKGDNEKALAKGREKVKDTRQTEAETLEGIGIEEIVKERKRGGPARKEEEAATKRKKKEHRDKNTSAIEGRGAEAKDGEDKVKEKKRGGKEKKRRSREKDNP